MAQFKYQAKKVTGEVYEKTVEASDRLSLYGIIREEGGTVVSIHEVKSLKMPTSFKFENLFHKIKTQEKINFAKNLGLMIEAGLSVTRALAVMSKQAKKVALKSLLTELEDDVNHGTTLSDALGKRSKVFSPLFISMVKAGEESGGVAGSLAIVASQMEKSYQLVKKVRGALIYPVVIIGVMIVLAILLLIFMVPTLTATFSGLGVELPLPTRILIAASSFLVNNTFLVLVFFVAVVVAVLAFWRSQRGQNLFDIVSLKIPVIGEMIREVQVARTARTLSSLLSSGVEIVVALEVTSEVLQNHLYKEALNHARSAIQKGEAMSAIFSQYEHLYPVFMSEMTAVGEETGKISTMLMGVAGYYEAEIDQKTKDLSTIIEPVLMVIIGIGVGIFAISMLAPTYSLVDYI
ncbi:MAG: type II secretion system F family protein [Candidatus Zambryskibacteria bacterium]|nr:type II secretion system F family protein [Candidatus Zambryskibacteria bacterium]